MTALLPAIRDTVPTPCLAAIDRAPFYAVSARLGDLGTKGGLRVDASARVLDETNSPIRGLYAIGNATASLFGRTYPGPGTTLGPAVIFGSIAAKAIADSPAPQRNAEHAELMPNN